MAGPKFFVRLNQVSALEHVRFNQVLLYLNYGKFIPEFPAVIQSDSCIDVLLL